MEQGLSIAIGRSGDIAKFWRLVGPLIASRQIASEIQEQVFDDPETVWFVAQDKEGEVQGFCAAHLGKTSAKLLYDWSRDGAEREKVENGLCDARNKYLSHDHAALSQSMTTHSKTLIGLLKEYGFVKSHQKGKFTVLHSTVVRQPKAPREKKVRENTVKAPRAVKVKAKAFHPVPKPSKKS